MNTTIIIPIHEYNNIEEYLKNAIKSIENQEEYTQVNTILVYPREIENQILNLCESFKTNIIHVINDGKTDYQSQVNSAVDFVMTDYFSVLEFDDELSTTYVKNAETYIKAYPNVDVFLSMMIEVNDKNEGIKLTNEVSWSQQFVGENGEMGYLNMNSLKSFSDFKLSGALIKKSEFINLGRYKTNIKLSFMYEFLLRALNNACKVFTIPKIGYKHLQNRENSMFEVYSRQMSIPERKFWFDVAINESNFNNDRIIDTTKLNNLSK